MNITVGYHQMNRKVDTGKTLKRWPVFVDHYSFGYMKGRSLDDWSALPEVLRPLLKAIALHSIEKNFTVAEKMSPAQFEQSIALIRPAALGLYQHWLAQRMSSEVSRPAPVRRE